MGGGGGGDGDGVRAGFVGFVERGFVVAAGFEDEEEGFGEGPDVVGRGATEERLVGAGDGGGSGRFTSGDAEPPLPTISTSDSTIFTNSTKIRS